MPDGICHARERAGNKKEAAISRQRPESREETPKEGMCGENAAPQ